MVPKAFRSANRALHRAERTYNHNENNYFKKIYIFFYKKINYHPIGAWDVFDSIRESKSSTSVSEMTSICA